MIFEELKAIQRQHGYLPSDQLEALSKRINLPLYRIHGLASFYPHFFLQPPARSEVRVCMDMTCHLRGADELKAALEKSFASRPKGDVSIRDVSCLGQCDRAPAIAVNDHIYIHQTLPSAEDLVKCPLKGEALPPPRFDSDSVHLNSDPYPGGHQYGALRQLSETRDYLGLIAALKAADLRGLGGAGFPTGAKWELVRNYPSDEKYIVCNADESEPGTFKDRYIIEHMPHLLVEGMALAGLVTGALKGILYIRHEYEKQERIMEHEIARCYQEGILGKHLLGTDLTFDLEIFVSPGGYICGEESALLEAIEGKRSEPRNKPPFPGTHGLWQKPTVINNVETFVNVPQILVRGVEWYKSQGQNGTSGLKFVGVSGQVRNPGVFEVPMGVPASELIYNRAKGMLEGRKLKGFAPSGPSSGYLPASMADIHMDFKTLAAAGSMLGSGAMVVCDDTSCMLDMALNSTKFFRNESCGKCVPCRMGSSKMVELIARWTRGQDIRGDRELIDELSEAMRLTSICGLGQVVPAPIASVLKHFPEEVEAHLKEKRCPGGVCFQGSAR
ncbi:MAG: NAD(P)H-dependent oxidoreductase subunit E [Candidatus Acidiferrales bacterium]